MPTPIGDPWPILLILLAAARERAAKILDELGKAASDALDEVARGARDLLDRLGGALQPVAQPLAHMFIIMLALLLAVVAAAFAFGTGGATPAGFVPGTTVPRGAGGREDIAARRLPSSLRHLTPAALSANRDGLDLTLVSTRRGNDAKVVTFRAASVTVRGIPQDAVKDFVGFYFGLVSDVLVAIGVGLAAEAQTPSVA